jgi:toxin FitB
VSFLVDTNVISELRRRSSHPAVAAWRSGAAADELYLSALVVGEVRHGIERLRRRDPLQAAALERWLTVVKEDFAERILPVTTSIAEAWGRLSVPNPLPTVDGLLAATALVHGLTLVTRETRRLERTGIPLLNPWEA